MPRQWTQFFSQVESPDFHAALEARIHDPLWLLTRQWQMGEFHGEDAGSPVRVEVEHYAHKIDLIRIADNTIYHPYRPEDGPLEARVEQESRTQVKPDLRTRAQVGMMFLQQLEQTGLPFNKGTLLTRFGFNPTEFDGETDGAVQLLLKRALDSERLYESFESLTDAKITEFFGVTEPEMVTSYRQFINSWKNTYAAQIGKTLGQDAWLEDRMEYRFAVSVPTSFGRVELVAEEYPGGRLDWDSFTIQSVNTSDIMHKPILKKETLLPSPVTFAGMPSPRFWEFEDGAVDFGNPDAVDRDLGRLLLAEFVMAWGNDWFQVPIEVPAGALCKINQLHVTDTFGIKTSILPQRHHTPNWKMNRLTQAPETRNMNEFLFVPPVLPSSLQAPPLEEVLFLRDEMANMVWAIEKVVASAIGHPQAIADQGLSHVDGLPRPQSHQSLHYQVMTDLPEHWLPLVLMRDPATQKRFLVRAGLLDEINEVAPQPVGHLLSRTEAFRVHEEEIPRAGAQVSRAYQLVRWYDGRRSLWVGRRKQAGIGEMRSFLEFDVLLVE